MAEPFRSKTEMEKCWHCQNEGICNCISCAKDTKGGYTAGPCIICSRREYHEALNKYLIRRKIDPRDHHHWRLEKTATSGFKHHFIPEEQFIKARACEDPFNIPEGIDGI